MREEKENSIDRFFREGLDNLNIIPPVDVWNNISGQLPVKKGNRRIFIWIAVAATVSLFAAFSGWNYLQKSERINTPESQQIAKNDKIQENQNFTIQKDSNSSREGTILQDENNQPESNFIAKASKPELKSNETQLPKILEKPSETQLAQAEPERRTEYIHSESTPIFAEKTDNVEKSEFARSQESSDESKTIASALVDGQSNITLAAIQLQSFDTPELYGSVNAGSIITKTEAAPAYDNLYAYEDVTEVKEKVNRWAIGGQMAPLYTYRNISEVNAPGVSKSSINENEKAIVTYASGVKVDFEASPRLTFQTGVYYMKMGQELNNVSNLNRTVVSKSAEYLDYMQVNSGVAFTSSPTVTNSTGTIVTPKDVNLYNPGSVNAFNESYAPGNLPLKRAEEPKKNIEQTFEFIEVPFLAKYKILNRKLNVHLLGGVSTHVLVDNKTKLLVEDNSSFDGKTADVETINYSSSVGFGVSYHIRKNLSISLEPTFKYYLNSFNSNNAVKLHPYAVGLYSGVSVKF